MNLRSVESLYKAIVKEIERADCTIETVMIVLGVLHNEYAIQGSTDENKLRQLYANMGNAAIAEARLIRGTQLQAEEDSSQDKKRKEA